VRRVICVESIDQSLANKLERSYGYNFKVCDRFLMDGSDVTDFINAMYSPVDRIISIKPNTSDETIKHEVCHAKVHESHPELYNEYLETFNPELRIKIEKLVSDCVNSMR